MTDSLGTISSVSAVGSIQQQAHRPYLTQPAHPGAVEVVVNAII
jgi:hypothetical protein